MFHDGIRSADRTHRPRPPRLPWVAVGDVMSLAIKYTSWGTSRKHIFHPVVTVDSDSLDGTLHCSQRPLTREMGTFDD